MFLLPQQGAWIEEIVASDPDYDLIGCATNRLGGTYQLFDRRRSENPDILFHMDRAAQSYQEHGLTLEEVPKDQVLAGMFLLFRKSLWEEFQIEEKSIQFDIILSEKLKKAGKRLGIARGIYIFHLYRLGAEDPQRAISHLMHCQDFSKIYTPGEFNE